MRAWIVLTLLAATSCSSRQDARHLELDAIRVLPNATLRTDTVSGDPTPTRGSVAVASERDRFAGKATFVLVDAENTAGEGAYVTLGGELTSEAGEKLGYLKPQSLWIPGGETRTFALVDEAREPRPASASARIVVRGALVPQSPPRAKITDLHTFDDYGKVVAQANLVNEADRPGKAIVIASFHDAQGTPMTRPFQLIEFAPSSKRVVQFVGPPGSKTGTIFVGELVY